MLSAHWLYLLSGLLAGGLISLFTEGLRANKALVQDVSRKLAEDDAEPQPADKSAPAPSSGRFDHLMPLSSKSTSGQFVRAVARARRRNSEVRSTIDNFQIAI